MLTRLGRVRVSVSTRHASEATAPGKRACETGVRAINECSKGDAMLSDDLVLARHGLDRDAARRGEEGLIERLRADSSTRILVLSEAKALRAQQFEGSPAALAWLHPDEVPDATHWIYLGKVPESHPAEGGARAHDEAGHSMPAEQTPALLAAVLTPQQAETLQPEALRW